MRWRAFRGTRCCRWYQRQLSPEGEIEHGGRRSRLRRRSRLGREIEAEAEIEAGPEIAHEEEHEYEYEHEYEAEAEPEEVPLAAARSVV